MEARSHCYFCRAKVVSITYSECVSVALGVTHSNRMRNIILSPVAFRPHFSTLSQKGQEFWKKVIATGVLFIFPANFESSFILKKNSARYDQETMATRRYRNRSNDQIHGRRR